MTSSSRCRRYTAQGTPCTRPTAKGTDWCGVCAGNTAPSTSTQAATTQQQSLRRIRDAQLLSDGQDVGRVETRWLEAATHPAQLASMTDPGVYAAAEDEDLTLSSAAIAELRVRQLDIPVSAIQTYRQRADELADEAERAAAGPTDPAFRASLTRYAQSGPTMERFADGVTTLGRAALEDPQSPVTHEWSGRVAAHALFAEYAPMIGNAEAFDRWVDVELSGCQLRTPDHRANVIGFRDEFASLAVSARRTT